METPLCPVPRRRTRRRPRAEASGLLALDSGNEEEADRVIRNSEEGDRCRPARDVPPPENGRRGAAGARARGAMPRRHAPCRRRRTIRVAVDRGMMREASPENDPRSCRPCARSATDHRGPATPGPRTGARCARQGRDRMMTSRARKFGRRRSARHSRACPAPRTNRGTSRNLLVIALGKKSATERRAKTAAASRLRHRARSGRQPGRLRELAARRRHRSTRSDADEAHRIRAPARTRATGRRASSATPRPPSNWLASRRRSRRSYEGNDRHRGHQIARARECWSPSLRPVEISDRRRGRLGETVHRPARLGRGRARPRRMRARGSTTTCAASRRSRARPARPGAALDLAEMGTEARRRGGRRQPIPSSPR